MGKQYFDVTPKITLALGAPVQIRLVLSTAQSTFMQGEFVGASDLEFVIVKLPSIPGLRNTLLPKTVFEVEFVQNGATCSFRSEVISSVTKPSLILFLSYPSRLSIVESREHKRSSCTLPVFINSTYGDYTGIISNISLGGCRVTTELSGRSALKQLDVDDQLVLQMNLRPDEEPVVVSTFVKSVDFVNTFLVVGLLFDKPSAQFLDSVELYVSLLDIVDKQK